MKNPMLELPASVVEAVRLSPNSPRQQIAVVLSDGRERTISEISEAVDMTTQATLYHLVWMRNRNLISQESVGGFSLWKRDDTHLGAGE